MAREMYHYTECGLDNVYLVNGFTPKDTPRGKTVSIADIDGLHRAIGRHLITERKRLTGKEIRFLRHELGLSQAALAALLGSDEQTVARWEKGRNKPSRAAEAVLRLLYQEHISENVSVSEALQQIADLENAMDRRMELEETADGWDIAA